MDVALGLVVIVALFGAAVLIVVLRRATPGPDIAGPLVQLTNAVTAMQTQSAVLAERVGGLNERVANMEQHQGSLRDGLQRIDANLSQTGAVATGLREATEGIRTEVAQARAGLTELQSNARARQALEQQTADSIRRLEQVIAGTASKGAAGENLIDLVFSRLPQEWQVRNFHVGARVVEFGLRLPNGLVMPIDSKWPATALIEEFLAADAGMRTRLKAQIETEVVNKAREVTKYLDPSLTLSFGVAVVPDAVYELCAGVQGDCARLNVVLVGHSMFVPYLLLVFQTVLRTSRDVDLEKVAAALQVAEKALEALQDEIEGRLSRAITMLGNSRDELRLQGSRAGAQLTAIQARTAPAGDGTVAGMAAPLALE
ncbi:MAG: DNA recombination protein RmuC [Chloroflexi bacterium]|nr:DNA recombination protein RmuC [Chloroflexota bacterium]